MRHRPLQLSFRPTRCPACGRPVRNSDVVRVHGQAVHRACAVYRSATERKVAA